MIDQVKAYRRDNLLHSFDIVSNLSWYHEFYLGLVRSFVIKHNQPPVTLCHTLMKVIGLIQREAWLGYWMQSSHLFSLSSDDHH